MKWHRRQAVSGYNSLDHRRVIAFFDEVADDRRLIPNPDELSGWGTYQKYRQAVDLIAEPDVQTVLDLGCNIGSVEYLYSLVGGETDGLFVAGIDLSFRSLRRANAHGLPFAGFCKADGCQLPFASDTFDLVICIEVIEHIADQARVLREIYRVLKPGGTLYLTTPNRKCLSLLIEVGLHRVLRRLFRRPQPAKDDFLDRDRLTGLLDQAGFKELETHDIYTLPRPFITFSGWSVTPPLPPKWGLVYQKFWNRVLGERGTKLPLSLRDKVYHTLSVQVAK